jgi:hypothetical protein
MELRFSNFQDARHGVDRRLGARSAVEKKRTSAEWTQWISYFYRISREQERKGKRNQKSEAYVLGRQHSLAGTVEEE